jgi:hypothetical protein
LTIRHATPLDLAAMRTHHMTVRQRGDLMARTRNLQVIISGDANNLNRAFSQVERHAQETESKVSKFGKATAIAFAGIGAAAGTAAVIGLKKSVDAAVDAQRSQVKLQAQLKASGISYRAACQGDRQRHPEDEQARRSRRRRSPGRVHGDRSYDRVGQHRHARHGRRR